MINYYYAENGEAKGPVPFAQLKEMARNGTLLPDDMVIPEGATNWRPAKNVYMLFPPEKPPAAPVSTAPEPSASQQDDTGAAPPNRQEADGHSGAPGISQEDSIARPARSHGLRLQQPEHTEASSQEEVADIAEGAAVDPVATGDSQLFALVSAIAGAVGLALMGASILIPLLLILVPIAGLVAAVLGGIAVKRMVGTTAKPIERYMAYGGITAGAWCAVMLPILALAVGFGIQAKLKYAEESTKHAIYRQLIMFHKEAMSYMEDYDLESVTYDKLVGSHSDARFGPFKSYRGESYTALSAMRDAPNVHAVVDRDGVPYSWMDSSHTHLTFEKDMAKQPLDRAIDHQLLHFKAMTAQLMIRSRGSIREITYNHTPNGGLLSYEMTSRIGGRTIAVPQKFAIQPYISFNGESYDGLKAYWDRPYTLSVTDRSGQTYLLDVRDYPRSKLRR